MRTATWRIWPYSPLAAVVAVGVIWAALAVLFFITRRFLDWPVAGSAEPLLYFSIALSLVPVILLLVDFMAAKGAVVGNQWINVDFSATVVEGGSARREFAGLPDNILSPAESIADSGGMKMVAAIRKATVTEIVCIDLKDGGAWWVTRLLVLCAGAVGRSAALKAIVFVGKRGNKERRFLGWGTPAQLLEAMLDANPEYRARLNRSQMITRQLALFGKDPASLRPPMPVVLHPDVMRHQFNHDDNESVTLAKILLQELQSTTPVPGIVAPRSNLEEPPDRLTTARLLELFDRCLYTDSIDRRDSNNEQLSCFLASTAPYVAIVREGAYEGMLRSELGERAILRELFAQSNGAPAESAPRAH